MAARLTIIMLLRGISPAGLWSFLAWSVSALGGNALATTKALS